MALGNPLPTPLFQLLVASSAAPTVFSPVSLIDSWDGDYNEAVSEFEVFMLADPIEVNGRAKATAQFGGYLADSTDTGQALIFAAEAAKDYVIMKVLWDGTNGFTAKARIVTRKLSAKAGTQLAGVAYTFIVLPSSIAIVGLGPTL